MITYFVSTKTDTMLVTANTTYTSTQITVKGQIYTVTVASGLHNYVSVLKVSNNPYRTLGKQFANFDEAARHYKTPEMKTELLKIELGF